MKRLALALVLIASPALAQQPPAPASEQALAQKLMSEISAGIQCSASSITLQQQLDAARARIKELEAKVPKDKPEQP